MNLLKHRPATRARPRSPRPSSHRPLLLRRFALGHGVLQVAGLLTGGTLGQLAVLLSTPLLARWVHPSDIAVYAGVLGASLVIGNFASLRWEILLPSVPHAQRGMLIRLALSTAAATSVATLLVVVALRTAYPQLPTEYLCIPALSLLISLYGVYQMSALSAGSLTKTSWARGVQGGSQAALQVVAAKLLLGSLGLILAQATSLLIALCILHFWRLPSLTPETSPTASAAFRTHWRQAALASTALAINSLGTQAPLFILLQIDTEAAATFALVARTVQAPILLLGQSTAQFLTARIAKTPGELTKIQPTILHLTRAMAVCGLAVTCTSAVFAAAARFILGPTWQLADDTLRLLAPFLGVLLVSSTLGMVLTSLGKQRLELRYQAALLLTRVLAMASVMTHGWRAVVAAYGVSSTLVMAWNFATIASSLDLRARDFLVAQKSRRE